MPRLNNRKRGQLILGNPNMPDALRMRTDRGNASASAVASLLRIARKACVPCGVEAPKASLIWHCPSLHRQVLHSISTELDTCQFDMLKRKRLKISFFYASDIDDINRLCRGRSSVCSRTKLPHNRCDCDMSRGVRLKVDLHSNMLTTAIVTILSNAAVNLRMHRVSKLMEGRL